MPDFVDRIIVVNDCSKDNTAATVLNYISKQQSVQPIIKNNLSDLNDNKYNRAEHLLNKKQQADMEHFIPSEVANAYPESDRVILINNLKNGGVGAAIARACSARRSHRARRKAGPQRFSSERLWRSLPTASAVRESLPQGPSLTLLQTRVGFLSPAAVILSAVGTPASARLMSATAS